MREHVKSGSGDAPVNQCVYQGGLINAVTTCGVDQIGRRFHLRDVVGGDQWIRTTSGHMDRHDIGRRHDSINAVQLFGINTQIGNG